jgi:hypothetical protein
MSNDKPVSHDIEVVMRVADLIDDGISPEQAYLNVAPPSLVEGDFQRIVADRMNALRAVVAFEDAKRRSSGFASVLPDTLEGM